jgi:hypothetical protein
MALTHRSAYCSEMYPRCSTDVDFVLLGRRNAPLHCCFMVLCRTMHEVWQRPTWGAQQPGETAVEEGTEGGHHYRHHSPGGGHGPPVGGACP